MEDPINAFFEGTKSLEGETVDNRGRWNTGVNVDQARQFLNGIGDINERWKAMSPGDEVHPGYLTSVVYPLSLGESMDVPLIALIGDVSYEWDEPIAVGDDLDGQTRITDVFTKGDPDETQYVFVDTEVTYERDGAEIATAEGTMIRTTRDGGLSEDRDVYEYTEAERTEIRNALDAEIEQLDGDNPTPSVGELSEGAELPTLVRGPLTIADMVCWHAGRGPTYGATIINYLERMAAEYYTVSNPKTGWPQKESHQHEDPWLCEQRGMPLPFANGVMMFTWTTPLVTNWMGDDGFLRSHSARFHAPYFYGDTLWVSGEITGVDVSAATVDVEWEATNQLNELVMSGESTVRVTE